MNATLLHREVLGGGLLELQLKVSVAHAESYSRLGQYTQVFHGTQRAYFFLAGTPRSDVWKLVLKPQGDVAVYLSTLPEGCAVELSTAQSEGFAWESIAEGNVALLLVGSGFGAAFAVLEARATSKSSTRLYLGVEDASNPPAPDFLRAQRDRGVEIVLCTLTESGHSNEFETLVGPMEIAFTTAISKGHEPWGAVVVGPPSLARSLRELQGQVSNLKHVLTNT